DPPEPMVQPNVPEALRAIVMKCLEKTVDRRYQSCAELAFDLLPYASDPVSARASAETTARMLTRRSTRSLDTGRAPDDITHAPGGRQEDRAASAATASDDDADERARCGRAAADRCAARRRRGHAGGGRAVGRHRLGHRHGISGQTERQEADPQVDVEAPLIS